MERNLYSNTKGKKILNNNSKNILQQKIRKEKNSNFYQNQNTNNLNYNNDFNLNKKKNNINNNNNYNDNNIQNLNINNEYNPPDSTESSLSAKIYEKNIALLNDKIKEQENNITYLNNRLKNYDTTIEQITKLNIELNKLNEVIKNKNVTIQEFRDIADMSKSKLEQFIKDQNELIEKIAILEEENKKLKNNNLNYNIINIEEYNKIKNDLNEISKENNDLKSQINQKDEKIKILNDLIDKLKNAQIDRNKNLKVYSNTNLNYNIDKNINPNLNYNLDKNINTNLNINIDNNNKYNKNDIHYHKIDYKKKNNIIDFRTIYKKNEKYLNEDPSLKYNNNWKIINNLTKRNYSLREKSPKPLTKNVHNDKYDLFKNNIYHKHDYSYRTEPNSVINIGNSFTKKMANFKNKYNYLENKYTVKPFDYNSYLLHNIQNNINRSYNK